jgi:hypothetical protein
MKLSTWVLVASALALGIAVQTPDAASAPVSCGDLVVQARVQGGDVVVQARVKGGGRCGSVCEDRCSAKGPKCIFMCTDKCRSKRR